MELLSVRKSFGFTLIEILIVVAIIGILAVIAIPNFLTAQTRAKVARAQADLYSIAVSLEEYRVDYSKYPPARTFCAGMMQSINDYNMVPFEITTPVPYISTRPLDIFNPLHQYKYLAPGFGWANEVSTSIALWIPEAFPDDTGYLNDIPYFDQGKSPVKWVIWSVGPGGALPFTESDRRHIPVPQRTHYDPTNGTISEGVIPRFYASQ